MIRQQQHFYRNDAITILINNNNDHLMPSFYRCYQTACFLVQQLCVTNLLASVISMYDKFIQIKNKILQSMRYLPKHVISPVLIIPKIIWFSSTVFTIISVFSQSYWLLHNPEGKLYSKVELFVTIFGGTANNNCLIMFLYNWDRRLNVLPSQPSFKTPGCY